MKAGELPTANIEVEVDSEEEEIFTADKPLAQSDIRAAVERSLAKRRRNKLKPQENSGKQPLYISDRGEVEEKTNFILIWKKLRLYQKHQISWF